MTEHTNTPALRFPEFKNDWIEKSFGDFTKTNQGLQIAISNRETQYKEGYYFYITNEFLKPNSKIKYYIKNPPNSVIANKDDILMTRTGNTGKVITGVHGAFHNNFFKIKFDNKQYDRLFIYELLKSSKINNKILSLAGTSTIPDLNHSDFYSIKSFIPKYEEQQKLGIFFNKLDRQIELEEKKLELLEQQKRGYMQKIFSQIIRFFDFKDEWREKKLGELSKKGMYGIGASAKDFDGKNIYIRISDINEQSRKLNYVSITSPNVIDTKYLVKMNDILFARTGASVGKSYIHNKYNSNLNYFFAGFLIKFEIIENCYPQFIYQYTLTDFYDNWVKVMSIRSGQPGINSKEYSNLPIKVPSYKEQKKIGDFFKKFDDLIELEARKIEQLKKRKQCLLQKMLV